MSCSCSSVAGVRVVSAGGLGDPCRGPPQARPDEVGQHPLRGPLLPDLFVGPRLRGHGPVDEDAIPFASDSGDVLGERLEPASSLVVHRQAAWSTTPASTEVPPELSGLGGCWTAAAQWRDATSTPRSRRGRGPTMRHRAPTPLCPLLDAISHPISIAGPANRMRRGTEHALRCPSHLPSD
jgi:hypothetical protein